MHLTPQLYVIRVSGHKYRVDFAFQGALRRIPVLAHESAIRLYARSPLYGDRLCYAIRRVEAAHGPPLARWLSAQRLPQQRQLHPRPQGRLKFSQSPRAHVSRSTTTILAMHHHAFIAVFIRWKISTPHVFERCRRNREITFTPSSFLADTTRTLLLEATPPAI